MTIIKHGKFYSDKKVHIDLYGKCNRCEYEFKTFVDLYKGEKCWYYACDDCIFQRWTLKDEIKSANG